MSRARKLVSKYLGSWLGDAVRLANSTFKRMGGWENVLLSCERNAFSETGNFIETPKETRTHSAQLIYPRPSADKPSGPALGGQVESSGMQEAALSAVVPNVYSRLTRQNPTDRIPFRSRDFLGHALHLRTRRRSRC